MQNQFNAQLQPHQIEAVEWLRARPKAVLADEVGLGKTFTALALAHARHEAGELDPGPLPAGRRHLCRVLWLTDAALIDQSAAEARKVLPGWTVLTQHEPEFKPTTKVGKRFAMDHPLGPDLLIMSHDKCRTQRHWLERHYAPMVIVDEAAGLKEGKSNHSAAVAVTARASFTLVMSATIIENNPMNFFNVMAVADTPGLWPKWYFEVEFVEWHQFEVPTKWGTRHEKVARDWLPQAPAQVNEYRSRSILRRTAADVHLRLPERVGEQLRWVALTQAQRRAYDAAIEGFEGSQNRQKAALVGIDGVSPLVDELIRVLAEKGDEQAIVYCEWLEMLDLIELALTEAGIDYVRIEGKTTEADRKTAVADFTEGRVRVLLGSRVLERGLNLQSCRLLISLGSSWNPAREAQREGRIRRIGSRHATYEHLTILGDTAQERRKVQRLGQKSELAAVVGL